MVGRIDERLREQIEDMLMAIVQHDVPLLVRIIKRIGKAAAATRRGRAGQRRGRFRRRIMPRKASKHFPVGAALTDMIEIMRRYRIMLPHDRRDAHQDAGHARRHRASCSARGSA